MIVHMTGLYTRLVTYARLHILPLVVSFYHDISYISFITLFLILIILLSFISVIMLLLLTLLLSTSTFPFTHTLIRSLLTTLNSHVQDFGHLLISFRCSCDRTLSEELEFLSLLILIFLPLFIPVSTLFLIHAYQIQSLFQCFLYDIMCGCLYGIL